MFGIVFSNGKRVAINCRCGKRQVVVFPQEILDAAKTGSTIACCTSMHEHPAFSITVKDVSVKCTGCGRVLTITDGKLVAKVGQQVVIPKLEDTFIQIDEASSKEVN